jgi:hypothetical protein
MSSKTKEIKTVQDEMREAHERIAALVEGARAGDRDFSPEEQAEVTALEARMKALDGKRKREEGWDELLGSIQALDAAPRSSARARAGAGLGALITGSDEFRALRRRLPTDLRAPVYIEASIGGLETICPPVSMPAGPTPPGALPPLAPLAGYLRPAQLLGDGGTSESAACQYAQYKGKTGTSAVVPRGGSKPLIDLNIDVLAHIFTKVAGRVIVEDERMEDIPRLQRFIDAELALDLLNNLDNLIMTATASTTQWPGLKPAATGPPFPVPAGTDPLSAVLAAAGALYSTSGRMPNALVCNYATAAACASVKAEGSGIFLGGTPQLATSTPTWTGGLRLGIASGMADGEAVIGDYLGGAELVWRRRFTTEISQQTADAFERNMTHIRSEVRVGLGVTRPGAFSLISGLPPATP